MTRNTTRRLCHLLVLLGVCGATSVQAQDCDALVQRAFNEFETPRRVDLLVSAVNPATCPPRGAWTVGVQLLAQTLMEDGRDSLASTWLRWAIRLAPDFQPDTMQFLPRVVTAFRSARAFVSGSRGPADSLAATTWLWPAPGTTASQGAIQLASPPPSLRVDIAGGGPVGSTGRSSLVPGSYRITASAAGYDSTRVTREVLPGVTTVIEFHLSATPALQPIAQQPAAPSPAVTNVPAKKGLPTWVKLGAAAGVVWAIAWNAYIKSH